MSEILVSMNEKLREPQVCAALAALDRLFAECPTPGDVTAIIREMRDSR